MIYSVVCISVISIAIIFTEGMHDGRYTESDPNTLYHSSGPIVDGPSFRYFRNIYQGQGRRPQDNGVRFGWQNPIRVAPTLRPTQPYTTTPSYSYPSTRTTEKYRDPLIFTGSNQHAQYVPPPPELKPVAQAQIGGPECSKGSRLDMQNGKCFPLGKSCGENMAFYEDPTDKKYGQCDCIQDANRPLVFHEPSGKCYFLFQQAFCEPSQWLIPNTVPNSQPKCSVNPCRSWTRKQINSNWNWAGNGESLDKMGPVALLSERTCALLGWPCRKEGRQQLAPNLLNSTVLSQTGVILAFEGSDLVCRREVELKGYYEASRRELRLICKPGLFNKWRLDGRCRK